MKSFVLVVLGVAIGFLVAHTVSKTPDGKRFFADVDSRAREFGGAVVDGYKTREAELRAAVGEADDVTADLTPSR